MREHHLKLAAALLAQAGFIRDDVANAETAVELSTVLLHLDILARRAAALREALVKAGA